MTVKKNRTVIPPEGGWQEHTWYLVDVAYRFGNPIHRSLYFTGFLNGRDGGPGGYNALVPLNGPSEDGTTEITGVVYLKAIKRIANNDEFMEGFVHSRMVKEEISK